MLKIEEISEDNVWEVCRLQVNDNQKNFVATNEESIIEAYTTIIQNKVALPYAIRYEENYIGFFMLGFGRVDEDDPSIADESYCLWRFMIDKEYQGKGYGKQAMHSILELIKSGPIQQAKYCWVSYEPENTVAKKMYESFGFIENGEMCDGEIVAVINLNK